VATGGSLPPAVVKVERKVSSTTAGAPLRVQVHNLEVKHLGLSAVYDPWLRGPGLWWGSADEVQEDSGFRRAKGPESREAEVIRSD
jgi:hypothetical protein